jgi:peptidoglycan/LPS O-acetylase OafA/YrhL
MALGFHHGDAATGLYRGGLPAGARALVLIEKAPVINLDSQSVASVNQQSSLSVGGRSSGPAAAPSARPALPANLSAALAQRHLPALDAVRAFAVLLVILYHHEYPAPGDLGVLSFFVLSGFLITWLLLHEHGKNGSIALRRFYIRRVLRLFPAFYLYWLAVTIMLVVFGKKILWPQAWSSFFYFNNYYQAIYGHFSSVYSHTWSLAVEEQFYLLWPVILIWLLRRGADLAHVLAGAIVCVWAWRAFLIFGAQVPGVWLYEAFDARADHLMVGCLLAVALEQQRFGRIWTALCSHRLLPALTLGLLVAEVMLSRAWQMDSASRYVDFIVQPLLVAALIVQWMAFSATSAWRWLGWAPLAYVGRISYGIYLHQQCAHALKPLTQMAPVPPILITLPLIIASASASYYFVERPFLAMKDKY